MNKSDWDLIWAEENSTPKIAIAGFNFEKNALKEVFKKLKLDKNTRIIDFGCGEGRTLKYIREFGFKHSKGIDYSMNAIEKCHRKKIYNTFLVDDKYKDNCDLLFSEGMLEHYDNLDEITEKMANMSREYIFLVQPITTSISYKFIYFCLRVMRLFKKYEFKENYYSADDYVKAFNKQGFHKHTVKTVHKLPFSIDTSMIIVLKKGGV